MKNRKDLTEGGSPLADQQGEAVPDLNREVIGWLLFIRHYGGNIKKYDGPSREDRAAQA